MTIRCPACAASLIETLSTEFASCDACDTIFARDRTTTAIYDAAYVAERYDVYPTTSEMSSLRASLVHDLVLLEERAGRPERPLPRHQSRKRIVLDVGYGNGGFIRAMHRRGWHAEGNDVNPAEYEGVANVPLPDPFLSSPQTHYRAITFFDSLEHFEDLDRVRLLSACADLLVFSFPCRPANFLRDVYAWRHYRPGEHHLYPTPRGLETIFSWGAVRAELCWVGYPEDRIRKGTGSRPNIVTCALRCYTETEA